MPEENASLKRAVQDMAAVMARADEVWTAMTCVEAESIAAVVTAAGMPETGQAIINAHAVGDDEGDDHYVHEREVTLRLRLQGDASFAYNINAGLLPLFEGVKILSIDTPEG